MNALLESALQIASHIHHPLAVVAFALAFMGVALYKAISSRKYRMVSSLVFVIGLVAVTTLLSSTFLQSRGVYRVRVVVLGLDGLPAQNAHVSSSIGGEPKKVEGGWEFDIPPQTRPADGKLTLFASVNDAFLTGNSMIVLSQDYYPTTTIQLSSDASATIRGTVLDERRRPVSDATVSVSGYPDLAQSDSMGNFVLPAHAAVGQMVQLQGRKSQLIGNTSAPAGDGPAVLILKHP